MADIITKWECPACLTKNSKRITKPRPFQGLRYTSMCETCDTKVLMVITKPLGIGGTPGTVAYQLFDVELTPMGLTYINKRDEKLKQQQNPPNGGITKGNE